MPIADNTYHPLAQKKEKETQELQDPLKDVSLNTFKFRSVSPTLTWVDIQMLLLTQQPTQSFMGAAASGV